jgi:phosphate transport system substrate-binding protein
VSLRGTRLAEKYMKKNPGAVVQVNGGGSGTGIAALINATVDLAQSAREMKDDEKQNAVGLPDITPVCLADC